MYKPGTVACFFIILLVSTTGCSVLSPPSNSTVKKGIVTEPPTTELPPLPEQYSAMPVVTPHAGPAVTTPAQTEKVPLIVPEQLTTINGTGLSGGGSNSSSSTSSTSKTSANVSAPVAQFTANTATGYAPLTVQFTDSSLNNPASWSWDFGDNSYSSLQNPSHTFATGGAFLVTLTAANTAGSSSFRTNISTYSPGFSAIPDHGPAPLPVMFTDTGSGSPHPVSWYWDFGDGSTCVSQNKIHTYTLPGTYDVKLRVTGPLGVTWVNKTSVVTVT